MKVLGRMWAKETSTKPILGKPMLWWCLNEAKKATFIDEIFVWSETEEVAQIAEKCGCYSIVATPDKIADAKESPKPDAWVQYTNDDIQEKLGTLGDVLVILRHNACLMTAEILEQMFVRLMEDMVADTIVPVAKTDPYLLIGNPGSKSFLNFWFQPGVDRQDYPSLYKAGTTLVTHLHRRKGQRLLHLKVPPEYIKEVQNQEDAALTEYYLGLRQGGKIFFPK